MQWRGHIRRPDDIWNEIVNAAQIPGSTAASKLQPISTRLLMLQTGMKARMGIKIKGDDLGAIEKAAIAFEKILKEVPSINPDTVIADRIVAKPYLEITIDREAIARYDITVKRLQDVIEVAVGGKGITTTVEGRERYGVRARYQRELRDSIETLERILIPAPGGTQLPLIELAKIEYVRGPQAIKSEDASLIGYVFFDKRDGFSDLSVIDDARLRITHHIERKTFRLPPKVSYQFAGEYENQIRAEKTLTVIVPLALLIIFIILYLQFNAVTTTLWVFSGIFVAWAGGFIMIWLYGRPWFLDVTLFGVHMQELFQVHPIKLSIAVWVGFLALFGIASDDGVVMATYLKQMFEKERPASVPRVREMVIEGAKKRIRACMMTTATTVLALLPVLTATGRGADLMAPMAIPVFGGMLFEVITVFVMPVLYCAVEEFKLKRIRFSSAGVNSLSSKRPESKELI